MGLSWKLQAVIVSAVIVSMHLVTMETEWKDLYLVNSISKCQLLM